MNILNLFKKKKKTAKCQLTDMILTNGEGCLVTTSEVIQSRKFWEGKMTEPETMSYTINYFKSKDKTSELIRNAIFEKYAEKEKVWIVSEDCIQTYDINTSLNGVHIKEWWERDGNIQVENSGKAINVLSTEDYDKGYLQRSVIDSRKTILYDSDGNSKGYFRKDVIDSRKLRFYKKK